MKCTLDQFQYLLNKLDPDRIGENLVQLIYMKKRCDNKEVIEKLNEQILIINEKRKDIYLLARDMARQEKFERAKIILDDLQEYFPGYPEGQHAKAFLHYDFPMLKVDNLMTASDHEEAEKILRELRKKDLSPDQAFQVENLLDRIANISSMRVRNFDARAKRAARNAKLAQEVYYNDREESVGHYTSDLNTLLRVDKSLDNDPGITYRFTYADTDGFTMYTTHKNGSGKTFLVTD